MLLLSFHIGTQQYAVSVKQIIEILPLTSLEPVSRAPVYVAGLLNYRGSSVPVINLCQLTKGQDYNRVLSSRIVLVNYTAKNKKIHPLGLIAEKVTETINIEQHDFTAMGLSLDGMSYLGGVTNSNGNLIQFIEINELLTTQLQATLFNDNKQTNSL